MMKVDQNVVFAAFFGFVVLPKALSGQDKPPNCKKREEYWGHGLIKSGFCEDCPALPETCSDQTADPSDEDSCLDSCFGIKSYDSTVVFAPSSSFTSPAYQESFSSPPLIKPITTSNAAFIPSTHIVISATMTATSAYVPTSSIYKQKNSHPTTREADKPSREIHVRSDKNSWNTVALVLSFVVAVAAFAVFVLFILYLRRRCRMAKRNQSADNGENIGGDGIALQDITSNVAPADLQYEGVAFPRITPPVQATPSSERIGGIQEDHCKKSSLHLSEVHC